MLEIIGLVLRGEESHAAEMKSPTNKKVRLDEHNSAELLNWLRHGHPSARSNQAHQIIQVYAHFTSGSFENIFQ